MEGGGGGREGGREKGVELYRLGNLRLSAEKESLPNAGNL